MKISYKSPNSGVVNYEILNPDTPHAAIILEFKTRQYRYVYNAKSPGPPHVAAMIRLATQGKGLATYVSQHVHERYAAKFPIEQEPGARIAPA